MSPMITPERREKLDDAWDATKVALFLIGVMWVVQGVNAAMGYRLSFHYGLRGRTVSSLPEIVTSPFLHFSYQHILANTVALLVLAPLAALSGLRAFIVATAAIVVVEGAGTWLLDGPNTVSAGASGLVYGYFGFILLRGVFMRSLWRIAVGLGVGVYYWAGMAIGLMPGRTFQGMTISWQGHLFGLAGGIAGAWLLREVRTGATEAEKELRAGSA